LNSPALPFTQWVRDQPGDDLGAKINAADAALGAQGGEVWITADCGSIITTPVRLRYSHVLRFWQGGLIVCRAPITLEQGCSIIGTPAHATVSSASKNVCLYKQFPGDLIVCDGSASDGGSQGHGVIENLTIVLPPGWSQDSVDCAIKITGTSPQLRASWVHIRHVSIDNLDPSCRWKHGILADGPPAGADGVRDVTIEFARVAGCGTDSGSVMLRSVKNAYLLFVITNTGACGSATPGITVTGEPGNISSNINLDMVDCGALLVDWASNVNVRGGPYNTLRITANASGENRLEPSRGAITNLTGSPVGPAEFVLVNGASGGPPVWVRRWV
jgi:hypothetical protein